MITFIKKSPAVYVICALMVLTATGCVSSTSQGRGHKIDLNNKKVEISYFDAKAEMQVNSATFDFYPEKGTVITDPKGEGKQLIKMGLTFRNTGKENFKVNYTQISLDGSTVKNETQTSLINASNTDDRLETKDLAPGESVTGAIYFEMPASDTKDTLTIGYKGYDTESRLYSVSLK